MLYITDTYNNFLYIYFFYRLFLCVRIKNLLYVALEYDCQLKRYNILYNNKKRICNLNDNYRTKQH